MLFAAYRYSPCWWAICRCGKTFTRTLLSSNVSYFCSKTATLFSRRTCPKLWTLFSPWPPSRNFNPVSYRKFRGVKLLITIFWFWVSAEQKPMINELMANIASGFPDLYNGWATSLPAEVQLKLKEVLAWFLKKERKKNCWIFVSIPFQFSFVSTDHKVF